VLAFLDKTCPLDYLKFLYTGAYGDTAPRMWAAGWAAVRTNPPSPHSELMASERGDMDDFDEEDFDDEFDDDFEEELEDEYELSEFEDVTEDDLIEDDDDLGTLGGDFVDEDAEPEEAPAAESEEEPAADAKKGKKGKAKADNKDDDFEDED
jgi:hypothetical protein